MSRTRNSRSKAPSQRQLRVGEELSHALARILARGELRDPVLAEVSLTVTEVRLSPDLKNATAFVVPLGGIDMGPVVKALNGAAAYFRGQMGRELTLRHTPKVAFEADLSFDEAAHIHGILARPQVRRDLEVPAAEPEARPADSLPGRDPEDGA